MLVGSGFSSGAAEVDSSLVGLMSAAVEGALVVVVAGSSTGVVEGGIVGSGVVSTVVGAAVVVVVVVVARVVVASVVVLSG